MERGAIIQSEVANMEHERKERKMTEERIYNLAWSQQLMIWGKEKDALDRLPDNEIAQIRERKAYERLIEIENMMKAKGYK